MEETIIETKNLTKKFHNFLAVKGVNIKIKKGEIYGLVGKNGAGKTTILKMFCGLIEKSAGEMELFSKTSPKDIEKERRRMGCIIEAPAFFPYLSATKNLEYYRIQRGIPEKSVVDSVLKEVELDDAGSKKFKNFSLGMKQRLGLALAMMTNPDLLILDEPINGLDPTGIAAFRNLILKMNRERNITVIISSHILSELSQLANAYGFIDKGEMIEQISAEDLDKKCRKCLEIKVKKPEKAAFAIENVLKSTKYEMLNNNEIRLYDYVETPEKVVSALVKNEAGLCTISQAGTNLESYFLKLIGGSKNA